MVRIQEIPSTERPRERLWRQGAGALRLAELLAILLRTGLPGKSAIEVADELLIKYPTLDELGRAAVGELAGHKGIGPAKATQLKAAFELGSRLASSRREHLPVETAEDVLQLLGHELRQLPHETARLLALNTKLHLIAVEKISSGTLNETVVHPREIFKIALMHNAAGFILVHNHPSGDPNPSQADIQFTRQLREAAKLMQVQFHDHVILGVSSPSHPAWFSFRENGYL
ncbi:MAG: DNA repair protein RadC [Verrucomicrobiales bacterium]|jgi:DNA repair protein RadC|nr:DNA repair protein RadC [Verrucomicrobiales bacterium]